MPGSALLWVGAGAVGSAIVLVVSLLVRESTQATGVARALEAIERVYAGRTVAAQEAAAGDRLLAPVMDRMRALAVRLAPRGVAGRIQQHLDRAGDPPGWTPDRILSYKGLAMVAVGAVCGVAGAGNLGMALLLAMFGALIGFFLPDLLLRRAAERRQDAIRRALPDVLDLLCVSVEAGLGFDAALNRIGRNVSGPLGGECMRVLQEIQIGKPRNEALRALATRSSVPELHTVVAALVQASDLGIPLGGVLREQAAEMRAKRRQRAEEIAQKLPVKIIFPVVLCILPALFVVVIGPGLLSALKAFRHFH